MSNLFLLRFSLRFDNAIDKAINIPERAKPAIKIDSGSPIDAIIHTAAAATAKATVMATRDLTLILSPYLPAKYNDAPIAIRSVPTIPIDCRSDNLSSISDINVTITTTAAIAPVKAHIVEAFIFEA